MWRPFIKLQGVLPSVVRMLTATFLTISLPQQRASAPQTPRERKSLMDTQRKEPPCWSGRVIQLSSRYDTNDGMDIPLMIHRYVTRNIRLDEEVVWVCTHP